MKEVLIVYTHTNQYDDGLIDLDATEAKINTLLSEGWQIISVVPSNRHNNQDRIYLVR